MKKLITIAILMTSTLSFSQSRFICEPTAGVNQVGSVDFSKHSKSKCNRLRTAESCRSDFRCTPVIVKKERVCESYTVTQDAITGAEIIYNQDGTVSAY